MDIGGKVIIFFGYMFNLIFFGFCGVFCWFVEYNYVFVIVIIVGGIEEDFIKCFGYIYMGFFFFFGVEFCKKGLNRIGNLFVLNDNYCVFEDWVVFILDKMLEE